ncbi:MAG: AAA-like domain-containing protein [Crocosphaera sp.]|nr:AAA-like domain-containing protein [Crocosphaera sp.]
MGISIFINMELNEALKTVNQVMRSKHGRALSDAETVLFKGSWQGLTYDEMVENEPYEASYFKGDLGHKFWKELSDTLGEKVSKTNFKEAIARFQTTQKAELTQAISIEELSEVTTNYYVKHPILEKTAKTEILKPGCLLRIKGSPKMGKTTFLSRLINYGKEQGLRGISLSMRLGEKEDFSSLDKFLQFFCVSVAQMLGLQDKFKQYQWKEHPGNSKLKATGFFEQYVLSSNEPPLILGLDELDKLFELEYVEVAEGFLSMLRSWHETAKINSTWEKLRLALAYVEDYSQLDINQSPFNTGIHLELKQLNDVQIDKLAKQYKLKLEPNDIDTLKALIGSHPYLINLTFQHLSSKIENLDEILKKSSTKSGIYSNFLIQQFFILRRNKNKQLYKKFQEIIETSQETKLSFDEITKLEDLGFITRKNEKIELRCQLYRIYFKENLKGIQ